MLSEEPGLLKLIEFQPGKHLGGLEGDLARAAERADAVLRKYGLPTNVVDSVIARVNATPLIDCRKILPFLRARFGAVEGNKIPVEVGVALQLKGSIAAITRMTGDFASRQILAHCAVLLGLQSAALGLDSRWGKVANGRGRSLKNLRRTPGPTDAQVKRALRDGKTPTAQAGLAGMTPQGFRKRLKKMGLQASTGRKR